MSNRFGSNLKDSVSVCLWAECYVEKEFPQKFVLDSRKAQFSLEVTAIHKFRHLLLPSLRFLRIVGLCLKCSGTGCGSGPTGKREISSRQPTSDFLAIRHPNVKKQFGI